MLYFHTILLKLFQNQIYVSLETIVLLWHICFLFWIVHLLTSPNTKAARHWFKLECVVGLRRCVDSAGFTLTKLKREGDALYITAIVFTQAPKDTIKMPQGSSRHQLAIFLGHYFRLILMDLWVPFTARPFVSAQSKFWNECMR